jgi:hypothetical protein
VDGVEHGFDKHLKMHRARIHPSQKISREWGHYTTTQGRSVTTTCNTEQTWGKKKTGEHTQKQNGHHTKSIRGYGTTSTQGERWIGSSDHHGKTKTLRRGDRPPDQDPEEPRRDTKGRRIPEENESEDKNVTEEDRDDNATTEVPQQEETQVQDKKGEQGENKQEQDTESDHAEQENNRTEEGRRR